MAYLAFENFSKGIDVRRNPLSSDSGSLRVAKDVVITRGGDLEKRENFNHVATLPEGAIGLYEYSNQLYTFGSADLSVSDLNIPNLNYVRLERSGNPQGTSAVLEKILSVDFYKNQGEGSVRVYAITKWGDGKVINFYNGAEIAYFTDQRASGSIDVTGIPNANLEALSYSVSDVMGSGFMYAWLSPTRQRFPYTISVFLEDNSDNHSERIMSFEWNGFDNGTDNMPDDIQWRGETYQIQNKSSNIIKRSGYSDRFNAFIGFDIVGLPVNVANYQNKYMVAFQIGAGNGTEGSRDNLGNLATTTMTPSTQSISNFSYEVRVGADLILSQENQPYRATTEQMAVAIADQINDHTSSPNFNAVACGSTITITAAETGEDFNGRTPQITIPERDRDLWISDGAPQTYTFGNPQNFAGGSAQPSQQAEYVRILGNRAFALSQQTLYFSDVGDPSNFQPAVNVGDESDAGQLFLGNFASLGDKARSISPFFDKLAIFGDRSIQIWNYGTSTDDFGIFSVLENTGSIAQHSVLEYGTNDAFYLADTGIRSLRPRAQTDSASTTDIGVKIDSLVLSHIDASQSIAEWRSVIDRDGRYILLADGTAFVLNRFPEAQIYGWTTWDMRTDDNVLMEYIVYDGDKLVALDANGRLFFYSEGATDEEHQIRNTAQPEVVSNFIDMRKPADFKNISSYDAIGIGAIQNADPNLSPCFHLQFGTNPNSIEEYQDRQMIEGNTLDKGRYTFGTSASHIQFKATDFQGLSAIFIHYTSIAKES